MKHHVLRYFAASIVVLFLATSCLSGTESIVVDVSPKGWNEPVELQYFNTDTLAQKQIDLILRHDRVLEKSNGRYAVEIMSPYGDVLCDTLSINILPNAQRNRLGETNSLVKGIEFTKTGDYHFTVSPLQNTTGIWSVGIELK